MAALAHNKVNFDVPFQAQSEELQAEQPALPTLQIPNFAGGTGWNLGSTGMMLQQGCLEFMT